MILQIGDQFNVFNNSRDGSSMNTSWKVDKVAGDRLQEMIADLAMQSEKIAPAQRGLSIKIYNIHTHPNFASLPHVDGTKYTLASREDFAATDWLFESLVLMLRENEFTGPIEQVAQLFEDPIIPEGGSITLSDRPGLGVTLNQKVVTQSIVA